MYIVPYPPPFLGGFFTSVGEEYQVVKRRRECQCCGEEYNMIKRERGSIIVFPIILRLLGRISGLEEGKGTEILGRKLKFYNMWVVKNIKF